MCALPLCLSSTVKRVFPNHSGSVRMHSTLTSKSAQPHSSRSKGFLCAVSVCASLGLTGCATKIATFVGVEMHGNQRFIGVVTQSAAAAADHVIQQWLGLWETGQLNTCYHQLAPNVQKELSGERLKEIKDALDSTYGRTQTTSILVMPLTSTFPSLDEALFKQTPESAFHYYKYVLARYINRRPQHNLVYFFGVGMLDEQLRIVTFGIGEERSDPARENDYVYWFGYPPF